MLTQDFQQISNIKHRDWYEMEKNFYLQNREFSAIIAENS